ncbi:MAG: diaminopimelate decarboxylase [Chitinophagaceae bacterium]|nr:diaminopimelate decarboxylase [Chitinophagaceae bacterium]
MSNSLSSELLTGIAHKYGTPVYIYDTEKISSQYHSLTNEFSDQSVRFFYACKALTNISILKHIHALGASFDCSSINEVKLARYAGIPAEKILYTSNSIAFSEIEEAQKEGVHINIDSLSNLEKFGKKFGNSYPVGIRLRPNIMAGGNINISTGHAKSKFGIPIEKIDEVIDLVEQYNLNIAVLHVHTGSEISDVGLYMKGVHVLLDLAQKFPTVHTLDLGGGFKVPYEEGDTRTDIHLLAEEIRNAFDLAKQNTGREYKIWFEPGKYMVSECGYFVVSVTVLKETAATTFAGVDSGFNHLIRPMFYGSYHHIENLSNPGDEKKKYSVVGNICETDTFAWEREIAEIREGDLLVFRNAGAYGMEMASNFNSRFKPAEVMVKDGKPQLIRKRDTLEDLLKNQVI